MRYTLNEQIKRIKELNESLSDYMTPDIDSFIENTDMDEKIEDIVDIEETEEFKAWFGNSKIVDSSGKPLVVYHGSPVGNLKNFEINNKTKAQSSGLKELGVFFTDNKKTAEKYRKEKGLTDAFKQETQLKISKLNELLNQVRNNRDFDKISKEIDYLRKTLNGNVYEAYLKMENPYIADAEGKDGYDGWFNISVDAGYDTKFGFPALEVLAGKNTASWHKYDYDGVIMKNIADIHSYGAHPSTYQDLLGTVYLVFNPNQIKLK